MARGLRVAGIANLRRRPERKFPSSAYVFRDERIELKFWA